MSIKCPGCDTENTSDSQFCKKCATPLPFAGDISVTKTLETPAKGLAVGAAFAGRYQIVEELGRGGMGAVYKALDTQINEDVAIKLIRPEIAADEKVLERFSNELKLARKISHKNVCRMFHLEKGEETPYISMEYLEGEDLKSLIREKEKLPVEEAIGIAQQVCEGLVEAHRLGVVHRDLKPQNIMIDKEGQAKIMDFGIARSVEAPGVTQTGVIIGTPDYISPEQAEGQEADHRSDIYSLGVILYEMVTGSVPFKGDTALSVALKHKAQLPLDPRKRNPEIPVDLSRLILICMEKDRTRRYQSAKDLLDDLRNIQNGLPLGTKIRPHRATTISRLIQRKWFIPAAAVLSASIIGIVLWRILPSRGPVAKLSGSPSLVILPFEDYTGDENLSRLKYSIPELLITDLQQSKYILRILRLDEAIGTLQKLHLNDVETYSAENLKDIADECHVSRLLKGSIIKIGSRLKITATLINGNTGETIAPLSFEAAGEEDVFSKLDPFSVDIKMGLGITSDLVNNDIDMDIADYTSRDPQARKLYIEGRVLHTQGEWRKSIEKMEQAVAIDPQFAMAYRSMASSYFNLGYGREGGSAFAKAKEFADRLPLRERLFIQVRATAGRKKMEVLNELLASYPDDESAIVELATEYLYQEEWDRAIDLLTAQRKKGSQNVYVYNHLIMAYCANGQYDAALEVCGDRVSSIHRVFILLCQGKYDDAVSAADSVLESDPSTNVLVHGLLFKGDSLRLAGDFDRAEDTYRRLLDFEESSIRIKGFERLNDLLIEQGKIEKAKEIARKRIDLGKEEKQKMWQIWGYVNLSWAEYLSHNLTEAWEEYQLANELWGGQVQAFGVEILLGQGKIDEAQAVADDYRERVEKYKEDAMNNKRERRSDYSQGIIDIEKEDYSSAIDHLKRAISLMPSQSEPYGGFSDMDHASYIWALAEAYRRLGDLDKARENFEEITRLTSGRLWYGDLYAKSFYMLGKIAEQRGWPGKAIDYYEKFLEIWKDADPGLPEVEDAKNRLEQLKN